jgi:hypothetical protein
LRLKDDVHTGGFCDAISMNKRNTNSLSLLRTVAQNAARNGHYDDARQIYQRVLKSLEAAYGRGSDEYNDCLKEAGRTMGNKLATEAS